MKNKMLKQNKNKKGSYTILVKDGYAVPKHDLKYYIKKILNKKGPEGSSLGVLNGFIE